jgi:hypothetical protein
MILGETVEVGPAPNEVKLNFFDDAFARLQGEAGN